MGLGARDTRSDLAMPLNLMSLSDDSDRSPKSDPDLAFQGIEFERAESDPDQHTEPVATRERKLSSVSARSVASRISNYVNVVKDTVSEASRKIPGFKEAQ